MLTRDELLWRLKCYHQYIVGSFAVLFRKKSGMSFRQRARRCYDFLRRWNWRLDALTPPERWEFRWPRRLEIKPGYGEYDAARNAPPAD